MKTPGISSCYYNHYLRYADDEGIELDAALREPGFSPGESTIPFAEVQRLMRSMIEGGCGGALGLEVGASIGVSSHGLLGTAMSHARNLDQCLSLVADYHRTRAQIVDIQYEKGEDIACIEITPKTPWGNVETCLYDSILALLFNVVRFAIGKKSEQCVIEYPYPAPEWCELYAKHMPAHHVFDREMAKIRFPVSFASIPCVGSDPAYVDLTTDQLESQVSQFLDQQLVSAKIRNLVKTTNNYKLSLDEAAQALAISKSTLNRRLHQEGETFKSVLESMKKNYASYLLKKTRYKIDVVSMQLGYDEVANFNRAFKRWFNCTPGRFREQQVPL